jgi:biopolymer transport protein TolQ
LVINREADKMEKSLSFLAMVGSNAPFIGLFGTVWGIMHSFQAIAASKNTTLAVVAPGIAEALLATAIGLMAAIPATMFYNILTDKLNSLQGRMEDFSSELGALLSRELDEGRK